MTNPIQTDDLDGRTHYTHPITGELLVRVTTVLDTTEGKPWLPPWAAKLAAEYAVDNIKVLLALLEHDGRDAAVKLVKDEAKRLRELKADAGTYVHDVAEALILWASPEGDGRDIPIPPLPEHLEGVLYDDDPIEDVVDWMCTGFTNFVADWNPIFEASEMTVYNQDLKVAGTLDTIVVLENFALTPDGKIVYRPGSRLVLCVDFKTGKHLNVTVKEQLAAYRRMKEALLPLGQVVPMLPTDVGAVLHLRPEHKDGYRLMPVKRADDARAWNLFRRDVEIYLGRSEIGAKVGKVARPPRPDGTMPAPYLLDLDGEGYGRVLNPLMNAGFEDLEEVALMTGAELRKIKGIGSKPGAKTFETVRQMLTDHGLHLADEQPADEPVPAGKVA